MFVLWERLHFPPLELDCANHLTVIEYGDQVRETFGVLWRIEPLQFLFQRQARVLAPLCVVPPGQLLPFRCASG